HDAAEDAPRSGWPDHQELHTRGEKVLCGVENGVLGNRIAGLDGAVGGYEVGREIEARRRGWTEPDGVIHLSGNAAAGEPFDEARRGRKRNGWIVDRRESERGGDGVERRGCRDAL